MKGITYPDIKEKMKEITERRAFERHVELYKERIRFCEKMMEEDRNASFDRYDSLKKILSMIINH